MSPATGTEFQGKTVEDAIEAGLAALGLKQNQVTIEVLSKGSRGLLGFGAEVARVVITPIAPTVPAEPIQPTPKGEMPKTLPKESRPAPKADLTPAKAAFVVPQPKEVPVAAKPLVEDEVANAAVSLLQGMLDRMDLRATVEVTPHSGLLDEGEEPPLVLNIVGDDLGVLIGRRGETLAAIQYLLRLMVNHKMHRWINVEVDVEGYKARREEQLRKLAERMADRVAGSGRAVTLEAMPARERRIIHVTLRDHPAVTTQSFGEGEHRKVTILPKS